MSKPGVVRKDSPDSPVELFPKEAPQVEAKQALQKNEGWDWWLEWGSFLLHFCLRKLFLILAIWLVGLALLRWIEPVAFSHMLQDVARDLAGADPDENIVFDLPRPPVPKKPPRPAPKPAAQKPPGTRPAEVDLIGADNPLKKPPRN